MVSGTHTGISPSFPCHQRGQGIFNLINLINVPWLPWSGPVELEQIHSFDTPCQASPASAVSCLALHASKLAKNRSTYPKSKKTQQNNENSVI